MSWSSALVIMALACSLVACGGPEPTGAASGEAASGVAPDSASPPGATSSPEAPRRKPRASPSRNPLADAVEDIEQTQPQTQPPPLVRRGVDQVIGADVSWPQCPKGMGIPQKRSNGSPMPLPIAEYVVLGLTNGPGFYPNPCLADQVEWVRSRGLLASAYAVASYPRAAELERYGDQGPYDASTRLGALANTGYQQALFNVHTMSAAGLLSPIVWIDVEPVPDFAWSSDLDANAVVVAGAARGYREAGFDIGVYSTPLLWRGVVGDLALGVPEWRAAGQTSQAEALSRCGPDWEIQGGFAVLGQWVEAGRDQNVTCPGTAAEMDRWFHDY